MPPSSSIVCIGHRGAMGHETQNTVASVKKAFELGATWVEVDIFNVAGELIVFHDRRLERLSSEKGLILDKKSEEIKKLRIQGGHTIPTLKEIFNEVRRKGGINIEIKGQGCVAPLKKIIQEEISSGYDSNLIIVSSFDHAQLNEFAKACPNIHCALLLYGAPVNQNSYFKEFKPFAIHYSIEFVTKNDIELSHLLGLKTSVYSVNFEDDIKMLASWGVDGIFSDYPELVVQTLSKLGITCAKQF